MKSIMALVLISLLFSLGIASYAQTPDGDTPALEEECDDQVGAAYGLCTAYCEAMDCNSEEPWASEEACETVKTNYEYITGYSLPCDPCHTEGGCLCMIDLDCLPSEYCIEGVCTINGNTDPSGSDDTLPGGGIGGGLGGGIGGGVDGDIGGGLGGVGGL